MSIQTARSTYVANEQDKANHPCKARKNMSIQTAKSTYVANEPDNMDVLTNHPCKAHKNMGLDLFLQPVFLHLLLPNLAYKDINCSSTAPYK
jgi:hypothetical protein